MRLYDTAVQVDSRIANVINALRRIAMRLYDSAVQVDSGIGNVITNRAPACMPPDHPAGVAPRVGPEHGGPDQRALFR